MQGKYADTAASLANLRQQLLYYNKYNKFTKEDIDHIYAPHHKLTDVNKNFVFTALKDGQRIKANPCTIIAHNYSYIIRNVNKANEVWFLVNLTPKLSNF